MTTMTMAKNMIYDHMPRPVNSHTIYTMPICVCVILGLLTIDPSSIIIMDNELNVLMCKYGMYSNEIHSYYMHRVPS